jgi:histidinol dehydrogenase
MAIDLNDIVFSYADVDFQARFDSLMREHSMSAFLREKADIAAGVRDIVAAVARRGDAAVAEFTAKFDGVEMTPQQFRISERELEKAYDELSPELLDNLRGAIGNVGEYQKSIFIGNRSEDSGRVGIRYRPLKRVGLCIPGASAPLPSTVIMTAVPAIVAGVEDIVVISPPRFNNSINPVILGLCHELGITEVYRIGGAQAVAALGWGTETIKPVDKIVGPGNDYVQLAKKEVFGLCDMDSFAGPSDVLIIADDSANPAWTAADMLSQAEHYPGAAILVTPSSGLAAKVQSELERQVALLDRSKETLECLRAYSAVVVMKDMDAAVGFANHFAAEHLEVQCGVNSRAVAGRIDNAGAIFIGDYSPVAVGDYWAGPSHTLPTRQSSRYFSAVTSNDFVKSSSIIEYSKEQLLADADRIAMLAMTEGLDAHAKSIKIRQQQQ